MTSPDDKAGAGASGPGAEPGGTNEPHDEPVKVTDKRRFDPETGELRTPPAAASDATAVPDPLAEAAAVVDAAADAVASDDIRVAELTVDLQRVTAEYANYRKRVERDREAVGEMAIVAVLAELMPVLDDIALARQNDDLTGPFKCVAESVEAIVAKLGLEQFGEVGEPFDPALHEALTHSEREAAEGDEAGGAVADVGPICTQIYQPGYRFKDRVVRPARVAVEE